MLRLLTDENFNEDIISGMLRLQPDLDVVRVQSEGEHGYRSANSRSVSPATVPLTPSSRIVDIIGVSAAGSASAR